MIVLLFEESLIPHFGSASCTDREHSGDINNGTAIERFHCCCVSLLGEVQTSHGFFLA